MVTLCVAAPIVSTTSWVADWAAFSMMPGCSYVLKPFALTVSAYAEGGTWVKTYRPLLLLLKLRVMPSSALVRVTTAFVMTAPLGSLIVPEMLAVVVAICPCVLSVNTAPTADRIATIAQCHTNPCLQLSLIAKVVPPQACGLLFSRNLRGRRITVTLVPDGPWNSAAFLGSLGDG